MRNRDRELLQFMVFFHYVLTSPFPYSLLHSSALEHRPVSVSVYCCSLDLSARQQQMLRLTPIVACAKDTQFRPGSLRDGTRRVMFIYQVDGGNGTCS